MAPQVAEDPLVGSHKYRKLAPLSSGSFGFVILYENLQTKEHIAIKFLERGDAINKYVEGEVLNHRLLRHPHVIEFKVRTALQGAWWHGCRGMAEGALHMTGMRPSVWLACGCRHACMARDLLV